MFLRRRQLLQLNRYCGCSYSQRNGSINVTTGKSTVDWVVFDTGSYLDLDLKCKRTGCLTAGAGEKLKEI